MFIVHFINTGHTAQSTIITLSVKADHDYLLSFVLAAVLAEVFIVLEAHANSLKIYVALNLYKDNYSGWLRYWFTQDMTSQSDIR